MAKGLHFTGKNLAVPFTDHGFGVQYFESFKNDKKEFVHSHDFLEMNLVLDGVGRHELEDETFEHGPGVLSIVHIGEAHNIFTPKEGLEILNVYIRQEELVLPEIPEELRPYLPLLLPFMQSFSHAQNRILNLSFDNIERVKYPLMCIHEEIREQPKGYFEVIHHHFRLFLIECARQLERQGSPTTANSSNPKMEKLRLVFDSHSERNYRLDDLASELHYSKNYLCRSFKAHTGKSILEYLLHRRLHKALIALMSSKDKIIDICSACGFSDLAYFNRKFKEHMGCSPREYRRKQRDCKG